MKKLLILDIDETLIHASETRLDQEADFRVGKYFVYRRPHVDEFLAFCFESFEVGVWTTATESYAKAIIANVFGASRNPSFIWTRRRCTASYDENEQESFLSKKMTKIRRLGYKLDNVLVIDDSPKVWRDSYGNLLRVSRFEGDPGDDELRAVLPFLKRLQNVENIRRVEKRNWRKQMIKPDQGGQ